jgi:hypothetical protein
MWPFRLCLIGSSCGLLGCVSLYKGAEVLEALCCGSVWQVGPRHVNVDVFNRAARCAGDHLQRAFERAGHAVQHAFQ